MKKFNRLLINIQILVIVLCSNTFTQIYRIEDTNLVTTRFGRVENVNSKIQTTTNFFPNKIGDFWEYIEEDTTALFSQFYSLKFSISREVLTDSTMGNGLTYKKIKWLNEANSINYFPEYEYLRVDLIGNAYIYSDTSDYILYDFTLDVNQTYPSHLQNKEWKVLDKYNVIGFGDTLQAIDFGLYDQNNNRIEIYTIVENFGIIFYQKDLRNFALPVGDFWGAVINGQEYGTLIVRKQTVDWKEFYPLHIGDYWVYEGQSGSIPTVNSARVTGDTLMPDGNLFYILKEIDYTFGYSNTSYKRIDSLGRVYYWQWWNSNSITSIKFNFTVGDTSRNTFSSNRVWRNDNKYIMPDLREVLLFYTYPDLTFNSEDYTYGIGLSFWTSELSFGALKGAYVNNVYFGDTTLTALDDDINHSIDSYKLFQNYPNPFNPSTTIKYNLKKSGNVKLTIYSPLGEEIIILVNEYQNAGLYFTHFDATGLTSGIYIYRITTDDYNTSKKMILIK